jgi:hypothetical protein
MMWCGGMTFSSMIIISIDRRLMYVMLTIRWSIFSISSVQPSPKEKQDGMLSHDFVPL